MERTVDISLEPKEGSKDAVDTGVVLGLVLPLNPDEVSMDAVGRWVERTEDVGSVTLGTFIGLFIFFPGLKIELIGFLTTGFSESVRDRGLQISKVSESWTSSFISDTF